jgi:hypothetical protein
MLLPSNPNVPQEAIGEVDVDEGDEGEGEE